MIFFFKTGSFSHVNENVRAILEREFPEHTLRTIDIASDILRRRPLAAARALAQVARIYPKTILLRRRKPTDFLLRTPAAFHAIKRWAGENVRAGGVAFTFQTQSLFDAGAVEVPHFVYTDQTCLANRRYPVPVSPELLSPRWLAVEQTVYESARAVFTTSTFARRSVIEDYGVDPARVRCVFSGVNVPGGPVPGERAFGSTVLFVGVDWERKGGPDLLRAFARVAVEHPRARLRILGCAPRVKNARIEVLGRVPLPEVARHFREADIFCLPSHHEPSAVALVEAMMHGLPVVSTRVGGTPDRCIEGETGFLVEAGDVEGLAKALCCLISSPERRRAMGEAGARFARSRFSWKTVGEEMAGAIRAAL